MRGWWSDPEKKPLIILLARASPSAGKGKPHCTVPMPTLHTAHCTVFTVYCAMHTAHIVYCTLHTMCTALLNPHIIHYVVLTKLHKSTCTAYAKCLILLTLFFQEMVCCKTIVLSSYFQILSQEALIFTRIKLLISLSSSFDCKIMFKKSSFQLRQQCEQCQQSQQCQQCQCLGIF